MICSLTAAVIYDLVCMCYLTLHPGRVTLLTNQIKGLAISEGFMAEENRCHKEQTPLVPDLGQKMM